jgi:hypothetical protein
LKTVLVWACLLMAGCAQERPPQHFDTSMLGASATGVFVEASQWWESRLADDSLFDFSDHRPVTGVATFGPLPIAYKAYFHARDGGGDIVFSNNPDLWAEPDCLLHAAAHELGHALGFPHSSDPTDIMYTYQDCTPP